MIIFLFVLLACSGGNGLLVQGSRSVATMLHSKPVKHQIHKRGVLNKIIDCRGGQYIGKTGILEQHNVLKGVTKVLSSIVDPAIAGGLLSGGLHAISGPDHLAALLPSSVGQSGLTGLKIGALWGIGHGVSATILGLSVYLVKGQFTERFVVLEKLTSAAESIVGLSILFIGLMGVKESLEGDSSSNHSHNNSIATSEASMLSGSDSGDGLTLVKGRRSYKAVFANGLLHGVSWDGAPSLAPAIAMTSMRGALSFLLAYSLGTIVTMSVAAGVVAELSMRAGKISNDPDLPRKLSLVSSMLAVLLGLYLTVKSFLIKG
eukprot:CAMPEP_0170373012 /NCGR_PEP_ID=MMETSP0117_2-20130122/9852_1 /TAXON_ID=400756 /ORGANISM="Durinskia baltica, Strain CSIRO CS-38" /LENGTH=317 /DNA_ID=CAMNT_0010627895 /DNA_START=75 /DNA_END=1028 /DNA_ORIENTATION=-